MWAVVLPPGTPTGGCKASDLPKEEPGSETDLRPNLLEKAIDSMPITTLADTLDPWQKYPDGYVVPEYKPIGVTGRWDGKLRVEPPNWWVGLADPSLELLIYRPKIRGAEVRIDYPGVEIVKVRTAESPNYLFVELHIDPDTRPGTMKIRLTKGEFVESLSYELQEPRSPGAANLGIGTQDNIYLIMPDRFCNGDPGNDVVERTRQQEIDRRKIFFRHGGDLQGVIDKLDYIKELGMTAIWLNPVLENDEPFESYHGYAFTNHYQVDPRLGDNDLYKELVEEAHKRGIKVVMDIVHNHVGLHHWWIRDLPYKNWVNNWDSYTKTSYRAPTHLDPYASKADKDILTKGWFDHHLVDINQRDDRLAKYLIQHSIWWSEFSGHDAYRVDTYVYNDAEFMSRWAAATLEAHPDMSIYGETWVHGMGIQSYFLSNNPLRKGFNSNLPSVTDFQLHYALLDALHNEQGWTSGVAKLYYTLAQDYVYDDPYKLVTFLDNHDQQRIFLNLGDIEKWKSGIALLSTLRGIPCYYYGTEILLEGASGGAFGEGGRVDFPGGWPGDSLNKFKAKGQNGYRRRSLYIFPVHDDIEKGKFGAPGWSYDPVYSRKRCLCLFPI